MSKKIKYPFRIIMCMIIIGLVELFLLHIIDLLYNSVHNNDAQSTVRESSAYSDFSFSEMKKAEVIRVKDGDTYVLNIDGEETTVRLIGVDTPESVAPSEYSKENTSEGTAISEIIKWKLPQGTTLYVEYDIEKTDKYGRTLAYLYFEDGVMVQEWLLQNGYAQVMNIQPNTKYAARFAEIQSNAADNKVGLWNSLYYAA